MGRKKGKDWKGSSVKCCSRSSWFTPKQQGIFSFKIDTKLLKEERITPIHRTRLFAGRLNLLTFPLLHPKKPLCSFFPAPVKFHRQSHHYKNQVYLLSVLPCRTFGTRTLKFLSSFCLYFQKLFTSNFAFPSAAVTRLVRFEALLRINWLI